MAGTSDMGKAARLLGSEAPVRHRRQSCPPERRNSISTKALKLLGATMDDLMVNKALERRNSAHLDL